jgi:DNA-directed RNA polymerase subunit RPC12/RpoP
MREKQTWWRQLQSPIRCAALTILAVALMPTPISLVSYAPRNVYLVRDKAQGQEAVFHVLDEDLVSWDKIGKLKQSMPDNLAAMDVRAIGRVSGLLAPTRVSYRPTVVWFGEPFSAEELREAHLELARWLDSQGLTDWAEMVRRPAPSGTLWGGYVRNGAFLIMSALALVSWGWVFRVPAWVRNRKRLWRLRHGLCGECGYSMSGTMRDDQGECVCPECGAKVLTEARARARASEGSY